MSLAIVTGATGFIGGALLRELLVRGWTVRALAREGADLRNLAGQGSSLQVVQGDLRDRAGLTRVIAGADVVFHVAARYSLWNPIPAEIYADNVEGTRNVLEAARTTGVRRVVYTSTVGVLRPGAGGVPVNEDNLAELTTLKGHYKRSKWLAEECARQFAADGLPVVIVNPTTPVGPWDVKPTPTGRMIVDFLRRRMYGYTNTGLNLVAVEDVACGHILAAERGVVGRNYILGAENYSLGKIFSVLASLTGLSPPRICVPRRLLIPCSALSSAWAWVSRAPPLVPWEAAQMAQKHMYFDATRARTELGFAPTDVPAALERAVAWFRANGYVGARAMTPPQEVERTRGP